MSQGNPFILSSGKIPTLYIDRLFQKSRIIDDYTDAIPSNQIYMLTGIRGSGKTVMMTDIEKTLEATGDFIVLNLSIDGNLIEQWASELYEHPFVKAKLLSVKLDLSLLGIGVSIEKSEPVSDIKVALDKMLSVVKKMKKKVLIAIDEAINNEEMRKFGSLFSIFLRTEQPVFLLMTGLPQNIYNVINSKTLTFFSRAPRIVLEPINYTMIRSSYKKVFKISDEESEKMALLTKGYSFGFQLLGYLFWERRNSTPDARIEEVIEEYDARLAEGAYDKIWNDLSDNDVVICKAMSETDSNKVEDIREKTDFSPQMFNQYRKRLADKGVVSTNNRGCMDFALPRFKEFVLENL